MDIHFDSHTGPAIGNDRLVIAQAAYIKATPCDRGHCGGLWCVDIQIHVPEVIAHVSKMQFSFVFELYNFVTIHCSLCCHIFLLDVVHNKIFILSCLTHLPIISALCTTHGDHFVYWIMIHCTLQKLHLNDICYCVLIWCKMSQIVILLCITQHYMYWCQLSILIL